MPDSLQEDTFKASFALGPQIAVWSVPFSVWRLMVAYALMMSGTALTVLIAGIIGTDFAPTPKLATLPFALAIIGVAASTLPTGFLQRRFGRRAAFLAAGVLAIASALLAAGSLVAQSFAAFCLATFAMGWAAAAAHQYRFAALELVPATMAPQATSVLLLGGIVGAFIGPEMAVRGRYMVSTEYAGSYLLLAVGYVSAMVLLGFYKERHYDEEAEVCGGRPLLQVLRHPITILAISSAAVAYGVMSFLMTATPISMHHQAGHSIEATKWVIQAHIVAMYLPSVFFAALHGAVGSKAMLWLGTIAYAGTLLIAMSGVEFIHFWVALVLLGIGWNFLFLTGTNLLGQGHRRAERFRVQAFNDFLIFSVQAVVALGSAWFLFSFQWHGLLIAGAAPVLAFAVVLLSTRALD